MKNKGNKIAPSVADLEAINLTTRIHDGKVEKISKSDLEVLRYLLDKYTPLTIVNQLGNELGRIASQYGKEGRDFLSLHFVQWETSIDVAMDSQREYEATTGDQSHLHKSR